MSGSNPNGFYWAKKACKARCRRDMDTKNATKPSGSIHSAQHILLQKAYQPPNVDAMKRWSVPLGLQSFDYPFQEGGSSFLQDHCTTSPIGIA